MPESPDKYEFPEIPKDQMTEDRKVSRETWGKRLHEHKVPNETAKALIKYLSEDAQKAEVAQAEARAAFVKQQEAALRKEWPGEEFKTNREVANRALGEIVNRTGVDLDELKKVKLDNGNFLLDDARMLKIFANIGRDMSEGTLGPTLTESESESIQEEIEGIRAKISEAQDKGDSKKANKLYEKEQALIARLKGDQPIVGSRGRAA